MIATGLSHNLWKEVNETRFHENTILLEVLGRSQGLPSKHTCSKSIAVQPELDGTDSQQWVKGFVDDFALVAAGAGGACNVTAACLEVSTDDPNSFIIRVAKNETFKPEERQSLQDIISFLNKLGDKREYERGEKIAICFDMISGYCEKRMRHHVKGCRGLQLLLSSTYMQDMESAKGLKKFPRILIDQYQELLANLASSQADKDTVKELATQAYHLRRSPSFSQLLDELSGSKHYHALKVLEKLGKIARYYRCAVNFVSVVQQTGLKVDLKMVPSAARRVNAIAGTSAQALINRIAGRFHVNYVQEKEIRRLLKRCNKYIIHAEILLLLFYEAQSEVVPLLYYIGINKRSCFLCYQFIKFHGRFDVEGSHQQLYSLWTLPSSTTFKNQDAKDAVVRALKDVQALIERKITNLNTRGRFLYGFNAESVANFSRMSLASAYFAAFRNRNALKTERAQTLNDSVSQRSDTVTPHAGSGGSEPDELPDQEVLVETDLAKEVSAEEKPVEELSVREELLEDLSVNNVPVEDTVIDKLLPTGSSCDNALAIVHEEGKEEELDESSEINPQPSGSLPVQSNTDEQIQLEPRLPQRNSDKKSHRCRRSSQTVRARTANKSESRGRNNVVSRRFVRSERLPKRSSSITLRPCWRKFVFRLRRLFLER